MKMRFLAGLLILGMLSIGWADHWSEQKNKTSRTTENLLRFHVLANSDSAADQQLKIQVRDAILSYLSSQIAQANNQAEAEAIITNNLRNVEAMAAAKIREAGQVYPVAAQLGKFNFPTRSYGDITLPAGEYTALRIVIGTGQGANWWCVLFPPLCFVDISSNLAADPALDMSQAQPVFAPQGKRSQTTPTPAVKWRVWEYFSTLGH